MWNNYYKIFEQWKEMHVAEWEKYETWTATLTAEELQLLKAFSVAYEYGFNTGYKEGAAKQ